VSGCAENSRDMCTPKFWGFPLTTQHFSGFPLTTRKYGDFHFTARWTEKGHFPKLQPSSETKLSVQALQKKHIS